MSLIPDAQVDHLLQVAESRLSGRDSHSDDCTAASGQQRIPLISNNIQRQTTDTLPAVASKTRSRAESLSLRVPHTDKSTRGKINKDTAGKDWFDMPRTELTSDFRRNWQLLRMRSLLDPKHQKKSLRATAPDYAHVGEIVAGPTEFFSARLTRRQRQKTMVEEVMAEQDAPKLRSKYAGIQREKSSGKKAFYRKVVSQRRRGTRG